MKNLIGDIILVTAWIFTIMAFIKHDLNTLGIGAILLAIYSIHFELVKKEGYRL